jgi:phospholipase/carboxylesterase
MTLSFILLHGLGADGNDMRPIAQAIAQAILARLPAAHPAIQTRIHCPDAPARPVSVNGGYVMPAWFDLYSLEAGAPSDWHGIEHTRGQIAALIQAERNAGIPSEHIILGGFSQGGVIALHTALHHPERLGALLALSTWLPLATLPIPTLAACQTPVFIAHGTEDDLIPVGAAAQTRATLTQLGYLDLHQATYPMVHSISMEEIDDLAAWLVQHLDLAPSPLAGEGRGEGEQATHA